MPDGQLYLHQKLNVYDMMRAECAFGFRYGTLAAAAGPGRREVCCALAAMTSETMRRRRRVVEISIVQCPDYLVFTWARHWVLSGGSSKFGTVTCPVTLAAVASRPWPYFLIVAQTMWASFTQRWLFNRGIAYRCFYDHVQPPTNFSAALYTWSFTEPPSALNFSPASRVDIVREQSDMDAWKAAIKFKEIAHLTIWSDPGQSRLYSLVASCMSGRGIDKFLLLPGQLVRVGREDVDADVSSQLDDACSTCLGELCSPMISPCCQLVACATCTIAHACLAGTCRRCMSDIPTSGVVWRQITGAGIAALQSSVFETASLRILVCADLNSMPVDVPHLSGPPPTIDADFIRFAQTPGAILLATRSASDLVGLDLSCVDVLIAPEEESEALIERCLRPTRKASLCVFSYTDLPRAGRSSFTVPL